MNIWIILNSLGAVALFLFGMKLMSDGIQRASGKRLRRFLNSMTHTKLRAVLAGIGLTTTIQSSSAVSLLIISFVNAGLIKLLSAFAIIVGANIGTTVTIWIISLGFEINLSAFSPVILVLTVPFYFSKNPGLKYWATFFIGFSLIFIGLHMLTDNLSFLSRESYLYATFIQLYDGTVLNSLLFVLIGLLLTIVVQSSSASTSLMVVLYTLGLPLESCAMMIIGANIGTTITAQIAAMIGNVYARQSAHFHSLFNLTGALIFFFIAGNLINFLDNQLKDKFLILATFHSVFNIVTAIILYPFLEKIAKYFLKYRRKVDADKLQLIHSAFSVTPELYIYEATNMLSTFAGNIKQTINFLGRMITESDEVKLVELHERILILEKQGDEMEEQIRTYLHKIFSLDLSGENSQRIHQLINISNELENIGDLSIKMSHTHLIRRESNSYITPKLRTYIIDLQDIISSAASQLIQNLNDSEINPELPIATHYEKQINHIHRDAFESLIAVSGKNKIKPESALYYRELIQNYELIGDHIYKANKALIK